MCKILLADDHPFIRTAIRNLLEKQPDFQVVGEAKNGLDTVHLLQRLHPDVVVLDIEMPYLNGIEVLEVLAQQKIKVPVLVLSAHSNKYYIQGIFKHNVAGYVLKEDSPEFVVEAINRICKGDRKVFSPKVASILEGNDI